MLALSVPKRDEWAVMESQAQVLVDSGFLPSHIKNDNQAMAIMLKGRELDIPPWAALTSIHVIQGNPTISPQLMLALIERSGKLEDIQIDSQADVCTVTMKRMGRSPHSESFTFEDAKAMGLANKDNYKKQAKTMLKWRAISACARVVFPDILLGMYTTEEIAPDVEVNSDGDVIDAKMIYNDSDTRPTRRDTVSNSQENTSAGQNPRKGSSRRATAKIRKTLDFIDLKQYLMNEVIKAEREDVMSSAPLDSNEVKSLAIAMGQLFRDAGYGDNERKAFIKQVFGTDTTKDLSVSQRDVLVRWMKDNHAAHIEIANFDLWREAQAEQETPEPETEEAEQDHEEAA